eukprot:CAMPEP_0194245942 /NCGR_PEP_ID=MMETSP0158-20130606/14175_1 /TAXON_ID=33649 /ORGANISM="Thalassionema nitzschioides, Strain L26-B" /LENGTH=355 /DNA_ID=CAMNT_0038981743 /DNA_START=117 /DNA_END=1180 /DNA_ORIENTATION=-
MSCKTLPFLLIGLLGIIWFSPSKQGRVTRYLRIFDPATVAEKKDLGLQTVTNTTIDDASTGKRFIVSTPLSTDGSKSGPTTFLLGIFSTPWEAHRRKRIRDTMLNPEFLGEDYSQKLCSLPDYLKHQTSDKNNCQIVYTFVLGGNGKEKTVWSSHSSSRPATVDSLQEAPSDPSLMVLAKNLGSETDITYLNVRENVNEGKSISWFDYASLATKFDYIGKSDTDSFINIRNLVAIVDNRLPTGNKSVNIYAGKQQVVERGQDETWSMQGGFYFLSRNLATCIAREEVRNTEKVVNFNLGEDIITGQLVDNCPEPLERLKCGGEALYKHGLKTEISWMKHFQDTKDGALSMENFCT